MSYRVYDLEQKCWVSDNIYLNQNDELFLIKQSLFGMIKIPLKLSQDRYVYHKDINLYDKESHLIHEGDYIRAEVSDDKVVIGVVVYAQELSSYIILCENDNEYFLLGNQVCDYIQVVGNVFDGHEETRD